MMRLALSLAMVTAMWAMPALAASEPPPGATACSGCHSTLVLASPAVPRLFGRDAADIMSAMAGFRDGSRSSTVMNRIAKGFTDDELRPIAAWLAAQK